MIHSYVRSLRIPKPLNWMFMHEKVCQVSWASNKLFVVSWSFIPFKLLAQNDCFTAVWNNKYLRKWKWFCVVFGPLRFSSFINFSVFSDFAIASFFKIKVKLPFCKDYPKKVNFYFLLSDYFKFSSHWTNWSSTVHAIKEEEKRSLLVQRRLMKIV